MCFDCDNDIEHPYNNQCLCWCHDPEPPELPGVDTYEKHVLDW